MDLRGEDDPGYTTVGTIMSNLLPSSPGSSNIYNHHTNIYTPNTPLEYHYVYVNSYSLTLIKFYSSDKLLVLKSIILYMYKEFKRTSIQNLKNFIATCIRLSKFELMF